VWEDSANRRMRGRSRTVLLMCERRNQKLEGACRAKVVGEVVEACVDVIEKEGNKQSCACSEKYASAVASEWRAPLWRSSPP
jgi:U3 small nucleolar ribonucleoprotein component